MSQELIDQVANIIDPEAFERYDPFSKSIFTTEYHERCKVAIEKAQQIIALVTGEAAADLARFEWLVEALVRPNMALSEIGIEDDELDAPGDVTLGQKLREVIDERIQAEKVD